jgi:hypothetical protein
LGDKKKGGLRKSHIEGLKTRIFSEMRVITVLKSSTAVLTRHSDSTGEITDAYEIWAAMPEENLLNWRHNPGRLGLYERITRKCILTK